MSDNTIKIESQIGKGNTMIVRLLMKRNRRIR